MAKSVIQRTESLSANETITPLQGTRFENIYRTGLLTLVAKANTGAASVELFVADRNSIESSDLSVASGALVNPDHVVVDDVEAFVGEKIQLRITDESGAANEVTFKLILDDNVAVVR